MREFNEVAVGIVAVGLDDAPEAELEQAEEKIMDQSTAAQTIAELEERIHALETQLALIEKILANPATYATPPRVNALSAEHEKLTAELARTFELWEQAEGQA